MKSTTKKKRSVNDLLTADPIDPVIERGLPFRDYLSWPAVSNTALAWFDVHRGGCPLAFKLRHERGFQITGEALRVGSIHHELNLEPETFWDRYALLDAATQAEIYDTALASGSKAKGFSRSLDAYRTWAKETEASGKKILTEDDWEWAQNMRDGLRLDPEVREFMEPFTRADLEVSILYSWPVPGGRYVTVKNRLDLWGNGVVADLKSTRTSDPEEFARAACRYGYDLQMALYLCGAGFASGETPECAVVIPSPKEYPHLAAALEIPDDWMRHAAAQVNASLIQLADCIEQDYWPGHGRQMLLPPGWLQQILDTA